MPRNLLRIINLRPHLSRICLQLIKKAFQRPFIASIARAGVALYRSTFNAIGLFIKRVGLEMDLKHACNAKTRPKMTQSWWFCTWKKSLYSGLSMSFHGAEPWDRCWQWCIVSFDTGFVQDHHKQATASGMRWKACLSILLVLSVALIDVPIIKGTSTCFEHRAICSSAASRGTMLDEGLRLQHFQSQYLLVFWTATSL